MGNKIRGKLRNLCKEYPEYFNLQDPFEDFCKVTSSGCKVTSSNIHCFRGQRKAKTLGEEMKRARRRFGKKSIANLATTIAAIIDHHKRTGKWLISSQEILATATQKTEHIVICVAVDRKTSQIFPFLHLKHYPPEKHMAIAVIR